MFIFDNSQILLLPDGSGDVFSLWGVLLFLLALFQPSFCSWHQTSGFGFKPRVDLILRSNILRNVPGFIAQIKDNTVSDTFIIFVSMDITAENFKTGCFIFFKKNYQCFLNIIFISPKLTND